MLRSNLIYCFIYCNATRRNFKKVVEIVMKISIGYGYLRVMEK